MAASREAFKTVVELCVWARLSCSSLVVLVNLY